MRVRGTSPFNPHPPPAMFVAALGAADAAVAAALLAKRCRTNVSAASSRSLTGSSAWLRASAAPSAKSGSLSFRAK